MISLSGMKNLVKKDSQFKLRVHWGEEELGIVAGKAVTVDYSLSFLLLIQMDLTLLYN